MFMLFLIACISATGTAVGNIESIQYGAASYNASTMHSGHVFMKMTDDELNRINNTAHSPMTNDPYSNMIDPRGIYYDNEPNSDTPPQELENFVFLFIPEVSSNSIELHKI